MNAVLLIAQAGLESSFGLSEILFLFVAGIGLAYAVATLIRPRQVLRLPSHEMRTRTHRHLDLVRAASRK